MNDHLQQRKQHILDEALRAATGRRHRRRASRLVSVGVYMLAAFGIGWALWPAYAPKPPVVKQSTPAPSVPPTQVVDQPPPLKYVSFAESAEKRRHVSIIDNDSPTESFVQVVDTYEMYAALTDAGVAADVAILGGRPHLILYGN